MITFTTCPIARSTRATRSLDGEDAATKRKFAGATLTIVTPAQYPTGLEIPVIARVEDAIGNRVGVNGTVTAAGFQNHPLQLLRGVGSVFLAGRQGAEHHFLRSRDSLAGNRERDRH